jgi:predicted glutamine amidotransferase
MCRLLAQVSPVPRTARTPLAEGDSCLLRQADADPKNPQGDGWGLVWFDAGGRPRLVKSGGSVARERGRFLKAAGESVSAVVLGHIRAASKGIPVDDAHAQPFVDEGWAFAHNGTLTIHREVAAELGPRRARLKTDSDSEVYFQQFLKHLDACGEPARAFELCVEEDWRLWDGCRGRHPDASTPYTSLNAIAADAGGAHALCHAARRGLADCGVCHPDQPWSVMSRAERAGAVLLASEGVDAGAWTRLTPPETVSCVVAGARVETRRRPLSPRVPRGPLPEVSRT